MTNKMPTGIYIRTEETRRKISNAMKKRKVSLKTRKKLSVAKKGRKLSDETKNRISQSKKGKKPSVPVSQETKDKIRLSHLAKGENHWNKRPEIRLKISNSHKGKKLSVETRRKLSESHKGQKSHLWKGGINTKERRLWHSQNRKMKILSNGGIHSVGEWENLKAQYNWTCPCCKKQEPTVKLTKDHIIPISRGGSDNIENIQPLCKYCNSRKNCKTLKYDF